MGIPPTGRNVSFGVIDIIRMADGKFMEHWGQMDSMSLMQQLGAIPAPGQAG
jgi:predicted ester cyclase